MKFGKGWFFFGIKKLSLIVLEFFELDDLGTLTLLDNFFVADGLTNLACPPRPS